MLLTYHVLSAEIAKLEVQQARRWRKVTNDKIFALQDARLGIILDLWDRGIRTVSGYSLL